MADYLMVVDMQEDYVGPGKKHDNPALVEAVNAKIKSYPKDRVIYIVNRFFWEFGQQEKELLASLVKVGNLVFEKRRVSCFTNPALLSFLREQGAQSLEFIGVDGNACVKQSVLSSVRLGFHTEVALEAVGAASQKSFEVTKKKWQQAGVVLKHFDPA